MVHHGLPFVEGSGSLWIPQTRLQPDRTIVTLLTPDQLVLTLNPKTSALSPKPLSQVGFFVLFEEAGGGGGGGRAGHCIHGSWLMQGSALGLKVWVGPCYVFG